MDNSGTNKLTIRVLMPRKKTSSLISRGAPIGTILEITGRAKYNLSLVWRVLSPHFEDMFLKF